MAKSMKRLVAQLSVDAADASHGEASKLAQALLDMVERNSGWFIAGISVVPGEGHAYGLDLDEEEEEMEELLLELVQRLDHCPDARDEIGADLLNRMRDFVGL